MKEDYLILDGLLMLMVTREEIQNTMISVLNEILHGANIKHIYPTIKRTDANLEDFLND